VLMRHAKSDWPDGIPDHERPLADRGRRDAPAMGRWLRDAALHPEHVACSTALRTRQTWALARAELELATDPSTVFEPRLYDASIRDLLDVIAGAPDSAATALVVGHNPGLEYLVLTLAGDAASKAREQEREKFPTAAVAVFTWQGGWDQFTAGSARLVHFVTPGEL